MIHPADRYKSYFMHSKRTHFIQWLKVENIQFSEQGEPSCAHNSTWPSTRPIQKQLKYFHVLLAIVARKAQL